jgi:hypothetical protein
MKKKRREKFAIGTKVKWCGECGVVTDASESDRIYPIVVQFQNGPYSVVFTREGRKEKWHKKPSLKLR